MKQSPEPVARARRVLVTGAAGFIGRHLVQRLSAAGHQVLSVVRRPTTELVGDVAVNDLSDPRSLLELLYRYESNCVVHAAWQGHPRAAGVDHVGQLVANVHPSLNLFVAAAEAGVRQIVFLSTGGGQAHIGSVRPAYGAAKHLVEGLLQHVAAHFDVVGTVLRPSAVYGPGQDPSGGLGAVATFSRKLLLGEPIELFGSVANGRDFLHVTDLAQLVVAAISSPTPGIFPVGGPSVVRLDELVTVLERAVGRTADVRVVEASGVEPSLVRLDNTSATEAFGWRPTISITAGAREVVDDLRRRLASEHRQDSS